MEMENEKEDPGGGGTGPDLLYTPNSGENLPMGNG